MAVYDKRLLDEARAFMGFDGNKRNASGTIIGTYTEQEYQTVSNSERNRWRRTLATRDGVDYDSVTYVYGSRDSVQGFINHVNDTNNNFHLNHLEPGTRYNGFLWTVGNNIGDWANYTATQPNTNQHAQWRNTIEGRLQDTTYWHRYWWNRNTSVNTANYPVTRATNGTFNNGQGDWQEFNPGRWAGIDCSGLIQLSAVCSGNQYNFPDQLRNVDMDGTIPYDHDYAASHANIIVARSMNSNTWSNVITDRNLVVPGDIIVSNGHATIVDRVIFSDSERVLLNGRDSVKVIEATSGPDQEWEVINKRAWSELDNGSNLRRLSIIR